jgi:hypothetical protein
MSETWNSSKHSRRVLARDAVGHLLQRIGFVALEVA